MTTEHHAGWARALDETRTLRAENERLTQELALVNDTLVQRTKAMHRALDRADKADAKLAAARKLNYERARIQGGEAWYVRVVRVRDLDAVLDDDGNVIDHAHEVVTTQAAGRTRHYCLTCGATTYNRAPAIPCPGRPT